MLAATIAKPTAGRGLRPPAARKAPARRSRLVVLPMLALALAVLSIASLSFDVSTALRDLRQAPRDNINWSILQLQTEFLRLREETDRLKLAEAATTDDFVQAFDIFYSRVETLKSAPILAPIRDRAEFSERLKRVERLLSDLVIVVDAGPGEIRRSLASVTQRIERDRQTIQELVVGSVATFAEIRDHEPERLVMLVSALAYAGLIVFVSLLVAILVLRRHSDRLQRQASELADSQTRLAATVGASLDAIIVMDEAGLIVDFNEQASQCFGYAAADALGRPMAELLGPERLREGHAAGLARFREHRQAKIVGQRIEIEALHAGGYEFPIELAVGVADRGERMLFVAYARDISRRRSDEAALREANDKANAANHAKSRFLAIMSHEMRTPLNGILGVHELLRDTPLDGEQARLVETANNSGAVLLDLINDVLDVSKMQAGKFELDPHVFNLRDLPGKVCEIIAPDAVARGNTIELAYPDDGIEYFVGDAKRLRQVLLNLVSNANKYTSNGRIRVATEFQERTDTACRLRMSVEDSGIGIPADRLDCLFTDFTTLDTSYARSQSGTGLGLAISRRIMDLFGGSIHVESTLGSGSRFWIDLELQIAEDGHAQDEQAPTGPPVAAGAALNILLAEDNATNALVAEAMLKSAGHQVHIVGDGQAAISQVLAASYDVILMDISMPGMDGLEATRHIRAMPSPLCDLPIIALTAHTQAEHQDEIRAAGIGRVLTKPIRRDELLTGIHAATRNASANASAADTTHGRPCLDTAHLSQLLLDVGPDVAPVLIGQFMSDVEMNCAAMTSQVRHAEIGDLGAIKDIAHRLAGCASTFGAMALAENAAAIETASARGDTGAVLSLIKTLPGIQAETLRSIWQVSDAAPDQPRISRDAALAV